MQKRTTIIIALLGILVLIVVGVLAGLAQLPLAVAPGDTSTSVAEAKVLSGTVAYRERMALPAGSRVEVQLRDTSRADAAATVIAEQIITTAGENVPIPFSLTYDPEKIQTQATYTLFARITLDDQLGWITDTSYPVLTNGHPDNDVALMLMRVSAASENNAESADAQTSAALPFAGMTFLVRQFNGETLSTDREYTVSFTADSVQARLCNSMGGQYTVTDGKLTAMMASTMMLCSTPPEAMPLENAFGQIMGAGASYTYDEVAKTLTLSGTGTTLVLQEKTSE